MIGVRRAVKSVLPVTLHKAALRAEERTRIAAAGLVAWRRPQDEIAKIVKENLRRAIRRRDLALPAFGDRWGGYASELRRRLPTLRTARELINYAQSPLAGIESHVRGEALRTYIDGSLADAMVPADLLEHFPSFGVSALISDEITIHHDGARFDTNSVNIAMTILRLIHMLRKDPPRTVCDIGGGIGATALAWLRNSVHRPDRVAIIDLPETLIFADALLRYERETVHYVHDRTPLDPTIPAKIILCPVSNALALRGFQFDLVTNTVSMQEMTDD